MAASGLVGIRPASENVRDVMLRCEDSDLGKPLSECNNKEIGRYGERLASRYLESAGYEIRETNWRSSFGEVDIVIEQDGMAILVEVKTRVVSKDDPNVVPELAVNYRKRNRYQKLALLYLALQTRVDKVRFDVISIKLLSERDARLRHYSRAFEWDN